MFFVRALDRVLVGIVVDLVKEGHELLVRSTQATAQAQRHTEDAAKALAKAVAEAKAATTAALRAQHEKELQGVRRVFDAAQERWRATTRQQVRRAAAETRAKAAAKLLELRDATAAEVGRLNRQLREARMRLAALPSEEERRAAEAATEERVAAARREGEAAGAAAATTQLEREHRDQMELVVQRVKMAVMEMMVLD